MSLPPATRSDPARSSAPAVSSESATRSESAVSSEPATRSEPVRSSEPAAGLIKRSQMGSIRLSSALLSLPASATACNANIRLSTGASHAGKSCQLQPFFN